MLGSSLGKRAKALSFDGSLTLTETTPFRTDEKGDFGCLDWEKPEVTDLDIAEITQGSGTPVGPDGTNYS